MLEEGVHSRHQYLATTAESAAPVGAYVVEEYKLTAFVQPLMNCSQRLEKGAS